MTYKSFHPILLTQTVKITVGLNLLRFCIFSCPSCLILYTASCFLWHQPPSSHFCSVSNVNWMCLILIHASGPKFSQWNLAVVHVQSALYRNLTSPTLHKQGQASLLFPPNSRVNSKTSEKMCYLLTPKRAIITKTLNNISRLFTLP